VAGRRRNPTSGSCPSRARQDVLTGAGRGAAAGERLERPAAVPSRDGSSGRVIGSRALENSEYSGTGIGATETGGPLWN
jgi:hypothetical protein